MITLFLISSVTTSSLVLICVVFTLVDVGGFMYFWGLTIDSIACLSVSIAIGFSVDYASHVGHAFMTLEGTADERARLTVVKIGPAVFNGGSSTLLAVTFLAFSESYAFITMFKVHDFRLLLMFDFRL